MLKVFLGKYLIPFFDCYKGFLSLISSLREEKILKDSSDDMIFTSKET